MAQDNAKKRGTVFQALDKAISGNWNTQDGLSPHVNTYDMSGSGSDVLYKTDSKEDYLSKKLELQQDKYLKDRWVKANVNLSVTAYAGLNNVKLMYRDADLMDAFPEIGAALDIVSEESTITNDKGMIVNVYSKSDRIKSILEDLFVNRLNIQLTGQMIIRAMCKYGNQFMLLDIDNKNGVRGWKQLPVFNMERIENGIQNPYGAGASIAVNGVNTKDTDLSTQFIWLDDNNSQVPFRDWQIAHFRLLTNSLYLPYGVSFCNAARRHWRMLSLMEDMMLIYRLERSIERRVYKIFVGAIDDADVQGYVERIANEFKRTPIVDPITGQVDLRKNILPVHKDTPIPLLDGRTITIEQLAKEFEEGKENYVYSVQDKTHKIVGGKVIWCGKNYTADRLVKITLDDDSYMIMAEEHEVIMENGAKKRADMLSVGEYLMPYNQKACEIKAIDIVDGDDVYCMTVVGPNGEEDRHNFALRTWKKDKTWNKSGCFVSNCVDQDIFIPVRDENAPTPIDTLSAAQNMTALDDIKFVQNKVLTALRIPKSFLNFEENAGDGKNLALMDIRFTRTVNRIQQAFLMELTKVASIHLFLLGFNDELNNFTLSMNNPSTQAEQLEIENMQKKIDAVRDAVSDPGNGLPVMSQTRALKQIMKWSEKEIKENLEEIRLEKGIVAELEKTTQIIKKTGIFDTVDRIYGEPGAEYLDDQQEMQGGMGDNNGAMGGMGAPPPPTPMGGEGDMGEGLDDLGGPSDDGMGGDINGAEGSMPTQDMGENPNAPMEALRHKKPLLRESSNTFDKYYKLLGERSDKPKETMYKRADVYDSEKLLINEEFDKMIKALDKFVDKEDGEEKED